MRRIGMGLVGPGFAGKHHLDAVRRLGFVDIVAIAASSQASARTAADALDVAKAYPTYQAYRRPRRPRRPHHDTQRQAGGFPAAGICDLRGRLRRRATRRCDARSHRRGGTWVTV